MILLLKFKKRNVISSAILKQNKFYLKVHIDNKVSINLEKNSR